MRVKDLIESLKQFDPELEVVTTEYYDNDFDGYYRSSEPYELEVKPSRYGYIPDHSSDAIRVVHIG